MYNNIINNQKGLSTLGISRKELAKILSRNLKNFRMKKRVSQNEVAEYLGIDRTTYTYWETGKTPIPLIQLVNLCKYYGLSDISDLLKGVNDVLKE